MGKSQSRKGSQTGTVLLRQGSRKWTRLQSDRKPMSLHVPHQLPYSVLSPTQVENMIVASADLSTPTRQAASEKTHSFKKGDFSGAFFQAGVSELTMACCCIGMALHGGVIPACGTFFVFSDYMKPAVRMAALMETPVKFIWTHDAFRVGETVLRTNQWNRSSNPLNGKAEKPQGA